MTVIALETVLSDDFPNVLWVRLHTDEGIVGLGETFYWPKAVAAYLHEAVAPYLIGRDPLAISQLLGGKCRDRVRIYNTCAGYEYVHEPVSFAGPGWITPVRKRRSRFEDTDATLSPPAELAEEPLADGITAMKIWPFDRFAA